MIVNIEDAITYVRELFSASSPPFARQEFSLVFAGCGTAVATPRARQ